jgi:23S rRNA (guanosine2251-2'-O)-methyltransferase
MAKKQEIIYGVHPVIEAILSGKEIDKVFIRAGLKGETVRQLTLLIKENHVPFQYVPLEKLNKLTTKNHQGVIAFISMIGYTRIEDLIPFIFESGRSPLLLVMDGVTDVRNLGAAARTAEGAGADAMIIPAYGSAQVTEDAIRASSGALLRLPVCRVSSLQPLVTFLKESGLRVIGTSEKSDISYFNTDMRSPAAIIMGSEEKGLSREVARLCDEIVSIPMMGEIESLNVSVAAGVMLFEAVRQRAAR